MLLLKVLLLGCALVNGAILSIEDYGAIRDSDVHSVTNRDAFNAALSDAKAGDVVLVPKGTWHSTGGITGSNLINVTIQIDGYLSALDNIDIWPLPGHTYAPFISLTSTSHLTITSASRHDRGTINGNGQIWWDKTVIGKKLDALPLKGKRPLLIYIEDATNLLMENLLLINSPRFHVELHQCAFVEVRYIDIEVDRNYQRFLGQKASLLDIVTSPQRNLLSVDALTKKVWELTGSFDVQKAIAEAEAGLVETVFDVIVEFIPNKLLQPEDLNTDGIDPNGHDIWIHHCKISNDDDSIAVKPSNRQSPMGDCTENILIEHMTLTGFGASIGSVPASPYHNCVRNITFRHIYMPETGKGVYIKSNPSCDDPTHSAEITDILYEDVHIEKPWWWAIWIGPQQMQEPGSSLGEDCSLTYPSGSCPTMGCVDFRNIVLRDVLIEKPMLSPGVLLGNATNPMEVTFDNVTVIKPGSFPFKEQYKCEHVRGISTNSQPAPGCFVAP